MGEWRVKGWDGSANDGEQRGGEGWVGAMAWEERRAASCSPGA